MQAKEGDLSEQLVANGLARVYGRRAVPPGASSSAAELQKLKALENQAKEAKLGGWAANISSPSKTQRLFPSKLDINTATEKELKAIPGIGPVMAARIIAARPFRSADDLKKVNGIGDKKYAQIRPYFN